MKKGKRVLVIGSGGREHALAWALARAAEVEIVYVAPGNGGTSWPPFPGDRELQPRAPARSVPIPPDDLQALIAFAREQAIDLTVVGPEAPLARGIVDAFQAAGLRIFGPTRAAARIETSKAFAKALMRACSVPTPDYAVFHNLEEARAYLRAHPGPVVVKASGLAGGKGAFVCESAEEAEEALYRLMGERVFGEAGDTVIIEERLYGSELSLLALSDGRTAMPLLPARDHKRLMDGDRGPNTGGMGAYAPVPEVGPEAIEQAVRQILMPVLDAMARQGTPFVGVLYAGLMWTASGPFVLEFNARFGDPEAQAILPLLETDLLGALEACLAGRLEDLNLRWRPGACVTVVLASPGYPGSVPEGLPISGLDDAAAQEGVLIFHAGTRWEGTRLVTAGGRVLSVSAIGPDLGEAAARAYAAVERIHFEGMCFRRDIGRASVRSL
ncbi:Phosphoribosylamine--glycine ligase [Candidatus Thermoflexus japonica]|uniref:Phosphoribosylamine--glycine ligase n=1 Tax=Candidatus Thermoflexus japonica TaxID=2035417 RepID=A0A2H5Y7S0_9CHLR|nr:Phosphoribosylamine--glycine ligase [Candidatus Thermoflexus japonica]